MTGQGFRPGRGFVSILRNGLLLLGANWVEALLRLVYAAAITRFLGAEDFGVWTYSLAAYTLLVGMTNLGFETLLPLRIGADAGSAAREARTGFVLRMAILVVAALVLAIAALFLEPDAQLRTALLLVVPALLGRGLSLYARWVLVGVERADIPLRVAVAMRSLEVIAGLALLAAGAGILALIALHALGWMADGLLSLRLLQGKVPMVEARFDPETARQLVRHGLPLGAAAGFTQWLTSGPIVLVRGLFGDVVLAGQIGLALQITQMAVASIRPFFLTALPVLARSEARGDRRVRLFGVLTLGASLVVFGLAAAVAHWIAPPLVLLVFGPQFEIAAGLVAPVLLIGGLMLSTLGYMQLLAVRGTHWPDVVAGAAGAFVLVAGFWWIVSPGDVFGAVLVVGAAWLARSVLGLLLAVLLVGRSET
jgi:O-antigen/teichoic acid export membrane protein